MTQQPPLISQADSCFKRPTFYADKCRYASWIGGVFILIFTGDIFFSFLAKVFTSLTLDWWFFSFQKKRDSDLVDKTFLLAKSITRVQIDNFVNLFVMTRRIAFVWSYIIGLAAYFYHWEIGYKLAFMASILLINLAVCIYCLIKKVASPYEDLEDDKVSWDFPRMSVPEMRRISQWDERESLTNAHNLIGLTNPFSPNYIGNSYLDR